MLLQLSSEKNHHCIGTAERLEAALAEAQALVFQLHLADPGYSRDLRQGNEGGFRHVAPQTKERPDFCRGRTSYRRLFRL